MGYVAFVNDGLEAAMHLLGDGPDAIRKAYSLTSQKHVDNSDYGDPDKVGIPRGPQPAPMAVRVPRVTTQAAPAGDMQAYLAELDTLTAKAERFGFPEAAVSAAVEGLMAKYGIGAAPTIVAASPTPLT